MRIKFKHVDSKLLTLVTAGLGWKSGGGRGLKLKKLSCQQPERTMSKKGEVFFNKVARATLLWLKFKILNEMLPYKKSFWTRTNYRNGTQG